MQDKGIEMKVKTLIDDTLWYGHDDLAEELADVLEESGVMLLDRRGRGELRRADKLQRYADEIRKSVGEQIHMLPAGKTGATRSVTTKQLLESWLKDGPRPAEDIEELAEETGLAWRTVERVGEELKVRVEDQGDRCVWSLPDPEGSPAGVA